MTEALLNRTITANQTVYSNDAACNVASIAAMAFRWLAMTPFQAELWCEASVDGETFVEVPQTRQIINAISGAHLVSFISTPYTSLRGVIQTSPSSGSGQMQVTWSHKR